MKKKNKNLKTELVKDSKGTHKQITYPNGVIVKLLQKPSADYKKKVEKVNKERDKLKQDKIKELEINRKIKDEMKAMAIERLKEKGEL